jgi:hypothetical protein
MMFCCQSAIRERKQYHTFRCDPATYERQGKLCSGPNEAEVARKLQSAKTDTCSMPVHADDSDFPATENG